MSKFVQCNCGEKHFCNVKDYVTTTGTVLDVIVCDGCGKFYREPENAINMNNGKWKWKKDE